MRRIVGTMAICSAFAIAGGAWACGDIADSHDDSFAAMTKPQAVATVTPAKKTVETPNLAGQKLDKRSARATQTATPVKVAARANSD